MVLEGECPPEELPPEEVPVTVPPTPPAVRVVRVPVPAPPVAFPALDAVLDVLRSILAFLRTRVPVFLRAATRSEIRQYTITDTTLFTRIETIPDDALSWELWNSELGPLGALDWAYLADPGVAGSGRFNRLASNQRVTRSLAGVNLYVKPATAGQIVVLEFLRP